MKKIVLATCLAAFALVTGPVMAQSKGEADPAQSKAAPATPSTKAEKAEAKEKRKASGKEVAKTGTKSDEKGNMSTGTAKSATKEQKAEAKTTRKVSAADSVKKGEIPKGEAGPTK
jgi:hypothetical protein